MLFTFLFFFVPIAITALAFFIDQFVLTNFDDDMHKKRQPHEQQTDLWQKKN